MNILQINTADLGGGAEGSAWNLFRQFRGKGHRSFLAVGQKFSTDDDVVEIPRDGAAWGRPLLWLSGKLRPYNRRLRGCYPLTRALDRLAAPQRLRQFLRGEDETVSPRGCRAVPGLLPVRPDIIHCHNLHGWYFDLSALVDYAAVAPVVLNLRDTWALTGHCAYFLDCERWQQGCGNCPRLSAYPRCLHDRTAENLQRKADILRQANVHLTAPSQWLAEQVKQSVLKDRECHVIPNGIDTTVFCPGDRRPFRERLQIPADAPLILFAAAARASIFKDYATLWQAAVELVRQRPDVHIACIGIGTPDRPLPATVHGVPYLTSPAEMAEAYRAADLFWHAALAEAFGKTVTEAMACGTPVVATAVGGLPEQIVAGQTGYLARLRSPEDFVCRTLEYLDRPPEERAACREAAARRGAEFSLERQAERFLAWYAELAKK